VIVVIDCGLGNVGSILNMLRRIGAPAVVSADPHAIRTADMLVLPGVGAFDTGMRSLQRTGCIDLLAQRVLEHQVPILGICLGMQLFTRGSEEGSLPGLGWLRADTVRFRTQGDADQLRVPHMGWNSVQVKSTAGLFRDSPPDPRFYFVHSYYVVCDDPTDVAACAHYGVDFVAAVEHGNILATQFHPEKSHNFGMRVLENFVRGA
jgi:glutamine amidotransferase